MQIALLGAEGTGKTLLTQALVQAPAQALVIADTSALMSAIYSDLLFQNTSLYPVALAQQRQFDLTLVMGLDLPWVADAMQRHGPLMRAQVDARLRQVLERHGVKYSVIYGTGQSRIECALQAIAHHRGAREFCPPAKLSNWRWSCEKCSDADCEHQLFSALINDTSMRN